MKSGPKPIRRLRRPIGGMSERRYDEAELAAILRSAAEAQAEDFSGNGESAGLTLREIERLASEVGIDPKRIASAAASLDVRPKKVRKFQMFGPPATETFERSFDGELDEAGWEEVIADLRQTYGMAGEISRVGSTQEWKASSDTLSVHLSATIRNGRTRFRLNINQSGALTAGWMFGFVTSFMSMMGFIAICKKAHVDPLMGFIIFGFVLTALYFITHRLICRWAENIESRSEAILGRLGEIIEAGRSISKPLPVSSSVQNDLEQRLTGNA